MLVIGYGNPLRGDDGIGIHVAHTLMEMTESAWEVIACHQLTLDLVDPIQRADFVVFVDADLDLAAGEIAVCPVEPLAQIVNSWSHQVDPALLLGVASAWYGKCPRASLIGVGGADFGLSETLSPEVAATVPQIVKILQEINEKTG